MTDAHDVGRATLDAEVDALIAEFGGNARDAIRALLHDLAILADDYEAGVSHGFVRGDVPRLRLRGVA